MDNKELAQKQLSKIIGLKPTRIKLGHGSFITIDLGKDIPEEIKTRRGTEMVYFGEWHFWIYMCAWRIDKHTIPLIGSGDSRTIIEEKLYLLENRIIVDITVLNQAFDVTISFEGDVKLHLFSSAAIDKEQWLFYTPDNKVFTAGPGNEWSCEDDSE